MSDTHETTSDIIAEMNRVEVCADGKPCLRDYARRFETARKRELDALNEQIADLRQQRDLWSKRAAELVEKCNEHYAKLKQVGNAAKLREAIEKVRDSFYVNDYGDYQMEYGDKVSDLVEAALAAPPRNCDVHTADELKAIFKSELVSELPIANEHEKNLVTITAMGVVDTLFATTKKGGNDADK